jgi:hypothetical protein
MTTTEKITAPFAKTAVDALNRWQACDWTHPFTCGNDRSDAAHVAYAKAHGLGDTGILTATRHGWVCPVCGYKQTWAHAFMLQTPPRPPWIDADGKVQL